MRRCVVAVAAVLALAPAGASALATPDPDALKAALVDAPSTDYVEADTTTKGVGAFDASGYVDNYVSNASQRPLVQARLQSNGFVEGYTRVWAKRGGGVALVEQIMAFRAASGARSYLGSAKLADNTSTQYVDSIDTSSIPDSYGVEDRLTGSIDSVAIVFAKGNDLIATAFVSTATYMKSDALTQASAAYAHAPDYTIQPAAPSSIDTNSAAYHLGQLIATLAVGAVVLAVIVLVVAFVIRSRRRPAVAAPVTMSSDGRYWWDGTGWQDAAYTAPPSAQRSPDGAFWWDGRGWRPVPQPMATHQ